MPAFQHTHFKPQRHLLWQLFGSLTLLFNIFLCLTTQTSAQVMDAGQSTISANSSGMAEVPETIVVQAVDASGNLVITGGETLNLKIYTSGTTLNENFNYRSISMTDMGDGTYEASYLISGGSGTIEAKALRVIGSGVSGKYYSGPSFSGTETEFIESEINFSGLTSPSIKWTGQVKAPTTNQSFTFFLEGDPEATLIINGSRVTSTLGVQESLSIAVEQDSLYYFTVKLEQSSCCGSVSLKWIDGSTVVPASSFYQIQKILDIFTVSIAPTSIPTESTVEGNSSVTAGDLYTVTLKSKDSTGTTHEGTNDVFTVTVQPSDGSLPEQTLPVTSQGSGVFTATVTLTIATTYDIKAHLTNDYTDQDPSIPTIVNGSPYTFNVHLGLIDPARCYTDLPTQIILQQEAGVPFEFNIFFVDIYNNLHYQTLDDELASGMVVLVKATYINHDDWPSPIGVLDEPDWQTTYGTTIQGTISDSNDGTIAASLEIQRAGIYTLTITVDGVHITNPADLLLEVAPSNLNAVNCVAVDVPETAHAGFSYQFLVQARDSYDNNKPILLEDAVSDLFSGQISNGADTVMGVVTDKEGFPGVFQVDLPIPESLDGGPYDWTVLFDGLETQTPLIMVYPCSNFAAFDLKLVSQVGNTVEIEVPQHKIGVDVEEIALPSVELFCKETQEQIVYFVSAFLTSAGGAVTEIAEEKLVEFGLELLPHGENPSLTLFTTNLGLINSSLEVMLSATVVQEPAWETKVKVKVNFVAVPYYVRENIDNPRFDLESGSYSTLQMKEEEGSGIQFFNPVFLICASQWSLSLPKIEGEEEGESFEVTVKMEEASAILQFQPLTRRFDLRPNVQMSQNAIYLIEIVLRNSQGLQSTFQLKVNYRPCPDDTDSNESSFVLRYDENPPTPFIESISQYGEVTIGFNDTMRFSQVLVSDEPSSPKRARRLQADSERDDSEEIYREGKVIGESSQDFKNFSRIHNSTFLLDGQVLPSLEVSLVPADPETSCSDFLGFSWELTGFTSSELKFQLSFKTPVCVSGALNEQDELVIIFFDQRLFISDSDSMIMPETTVRSKIRRQIAKNGEEELLASMTTAAVVAVATTGVVSLILGVLLEGAMKRILNVVKGLQIILHMMLIQIFLVAHAEEFIGSLQGIVFANMYDREKISRMGVNETAAYQDGDDEIVQQTRQATQEEESSFQVSPLAMSMIGLPVVILVIYLCARYCPWAKLRGICKREQPKTLNRVYLFFDGSLLVFLVSGIITVIQFKVRANHDILNFYSSIVFVLLTIPATLILVGYLLYNFKELKTKRMKDYIGAAYSNFNIRSRPVLAFLLLTFARRIALCFLVTLGRTNTIAQLGFINYSSLALIAVIATVKPFAVRSQNVLELANEFSILLLLSHCLTQTEFVQDPRGRWLAGWSLNGLVIINVAGNMVFILMKEGSALYRLLRHGYLRRQMTKRNEEAGERQQKIDLYRNSVLLKEFCYLNKDPEQQQNRNMVEVVVRRREGPVVDSLQDVAENSLPKAQQDSKKSFRLSQEESLIQSSSLKSPTSAFFEKDSMQGELSYRRNQADMLPQPQFSGHQIAVKAKATVGSIPNNKQHMVELKERKLFDWMPINFKLTPTMGVVNSMKEQAAQMSAPKQIEAVKQARIRQMETCIMLPVAKKSFSEPIHRAPMMEPSLPTTQYPFTISAMESQVKKVQFEQSEPSSDNFWLD